VAEREFKLPDLGEGLTEGEVVRWLVAEGEAIALNQPIVEVETAKAVVEIPSPYAGTVVKLHAGEGDTIDVGAPLISVDTGGGAAPATSAAAGSASVASAPASAGSAQASAAPDSAAADGDGVAQELQATLVGPGERQQTRRRRVATHARANGPAPAVDNGERATADSATLPNRGPRQPRAGLWGVPPPGRELGHLRRRRRSSRRSGGWSRRWSRW
jgi:2-oxoisovalerate dehydrogenase E2 component (dihydrolipoyl transacylase)